MKRRVPIPTLALYGLSVLIGFIAGLGAAVFRGLIAFFHNLLFLGNLSLVYDANIHTPVSPWGAWVILVPVIGALGVTFLVKNFAPEAKGHGVPEVMDAIYYGRGIIRPAVAAVKSLASALSIGSGGAVGREGPIIQIGSSFGSTMGQILPMPAWQRITLVASGAGAGIAATFNTPLGGVLFAAEIVLHEISVRTVVPVALSTATATYVGRMFFGTHPSFLIPAFETHYFHLTKPAVLISYVGLGLLMGIVSAIYVKGIYAFEDFFERIRASYYMRHVGGMLVVGLLMYLLLLKTGHYYIQGVGYSTVQDILTGQLSQIRLLLLLFALKLLATSLTLGSGASGGVFSPALYLGATLGAAYGAGLEHLFPGQLMDPQAFAVAGMAGVVGGATGAAMAAIVMIFEMTLDYNIILPMTITVALSYGMRQMLLEESIYTLKLVRRGHRIPGALQTNLHYLKRAGDLMEGQFLILNGSKPLKEFARIASQGDHVSCFLVEEQGNITGFITKEAALRALDPASAAVEIREIADAHYTPVREDAALLDIMASMRASGSVVGVVTNGADHLSATQVRGVITSQHLSAAMVESAELFSG